jgi:hypothetical protein
MRGVESRLDGETLVVRIPMRFQRRGGRKRIVAPDGSAISPSSKPQPDGTLLKALARAWRWQGVVECGDYGTVADLATPNGSVAPTSAVSCGSCSSPLISSDGSSTAGRRQGSRGF